MWLIWQGIWETKEEVWRGGGGGVELFCLITPTINKDSLKVFSLSSERSLTHFCTAVLTPALSHSTAAKSEASHVPDQTEIGWNKICSVNYFKAKTETFKCFKRKQYCSGFNFILTGFNLIKASFKSNPCSLP